jgi:chromosome segregation ATPase
MDIVDKLRGDYHADFTDDAASEIEQLRQRVAELEKERDDFRRDAAEFSSQVSRLVDHNNNLVNHREELILEITRIKRGDFSNERIENDSLKLCINVQNEQIEKLTAERDALKQQRDGLLKACETYMSHGMCDVTYYTIRNAIASVKEK